MGKNYNHLSCAIKVVCKRFSNDFVAKIVAEIGWKSFRKCALKEAVTVRMTAQMPSSLPV